MTAAVSRSSSSSGSARASRSSCSSCWSCALLVAFGLCSLVQLVLIAGDVPVTRWTVGVLTPLLAAWVLLRRGPRLLAAGLLASACGDLLLPQDALFVAGMGCFAVAHLCYVACFWRLGARPGRLPSALYLLAFAGMLVLVLPGLESGLRIPVPAYALLLTSTAAMSRSLGPAAAVGGGLFFVSDGLIALNMADTLALGTPWHDLAVMGTYLPAQALLALGAVRWSARPGSVPDTSGTAPDAGQDVGTRGGDHHPAGGCGGPTPGRGQGGPTVVSPGGRRGR